MLKQLKMCNHLCDKCAFRCRWKSAKSSLSEFPGLIRATGRNRWSNDSMQHNKDTHKTNSQLLISTQPIYHVYYLVRVLDTTRLYHACLTAVQWTRQPAVARETPYTLCVDISGKKVSGVRRGFTKSLFCRHNVLIAYTIDITSKWAQLVSATHTVSMTD